LVCRAAVCVNNDWLRAPRATARNHLAFGEGRRHQPDASAFSVFSVAPCEAFSLNMNDRLEGYQELRRLPPSQLAQPRGAGRVSA
jgi:hypothetical protein